LRPIHERRHDAAARGGLRGFTLIELLVVMLLIGIFLGMGVGVYLRLGETLRYRTTVGRVKTLIRKTRNFAVSGGGPAMVTFDPKAGRLNGTGNRAVGLWHFEDERGAFARVARIRGGEIREGGRFGRGVHFEKGGSIDLGTSPEFDPPEGIFAEAYVRPESILPQTVLAKGGSWNLGMDGEGRLRASIRVEGGGTVTATAEQDGLGVGRWSRAGILYDRRRLVVLKDGREVASVAESLPLESDPAKPLTIGTSREPIRGWVDEMRIYRMIPGEGVELPEGMSFEATTPSLVFREGGTLDPEFHRGPVTLRLHLPGGEEAITVGWLGMILEGGKG
jgi:prepilin-type N-terminal cleavage/methylation domain-containing protein